MENWSQKLDLYDLMSRHGSPLYVHHPETLWNNFQEYRGLVGEAECIRYPVKANPSPLVLEALARWGAGADCASLPEVRSALAADGTVCVGSFDGHLSAVAPDGSEVWSFLTSGSVLSSPALGADGTVYFGTDLGLVFAVGPASP